MEDTRTLGQVIRQYQTVEQIKGRLIKMGLLEGDATAADVEKALKKLIPVGTFSGTKEA